MKRGFMHKPLQRRIQPLPCARGPKGRTHYRSMAVIAFFALCCLSCSNPHLNRMFGKDSAPSSDPGTFAFTVSFNANNGSGSIAPLGGENGDSITLPVSGFSRGGKTLAGWNTAADGGGNPYALGASYTISGSVVLYAVWNWTNAGTVGDPYLISDAASFLEINKDTDAHYKLENDITISGHYEGPWVFRPGIIEDFIGTFDGNGHAINLDSVTALVNPASLTEEPGFGLFGTSAVPGALIKNLKVTGSITATRNDGGSQFYLGGIVGWTSNGTTIQNCVSAVDLTAIGGYAGGIVGANQSSSIICCYATGAVSASQGVQNFSYGGSIGAGGISGLSQNTVTACYAANTVSASGGGTNDVYTGGIGGWFWGGTITNSVALNPNLNASGSGTLTIWRIGYNGSNNHGRDDMLMYQNGSPYSWTAGTTNGADVAASQYQSESWWAGVFGSYWGGGSASEIAPWKWDATLQRPVLWFE